MLPRDRNGHLFRGYLTDIYGNNNNNSTNMVFAFIMQYFDMAVAFINKQ